MKVYYRCRKGLAARLVLVRLGGMVVVSGLAGSPIQNVHFENCKITAQKGFRPDHARNVDLSGLQLELKEGDAVTKTDVQ